ncbi:hypothetical protein GN244_ATG10428 [Phytophthora infestans]|uniref:Uncharacterized protein n=1 Tax=Phytophthora infestans TaxID=4787 RepID=A0A833T573_PHYIN|nr:hypothetical protein GN244_ATG10428 [Phytophthora infestans]
MDIQYVDTADEEPVVIDDNDYKVYTPTIAPINVKPFTFDTDKLRSDANIREKTLSLVMANMNQSSK